MEDNNIFTGKTTEEAIATGLEALGLTAEQAEITVLEEAKKKIIGGVRAKVKIVKRLTDGQRAEGFVEGLFDILKVNVVTELVQDDDKVVINLTSTESSRVIGRHGEVLDAVQTLAGAVANIGREEYKKVVVDCESYREGREKTLVELAHKLAKKAVEKRKRVSLEPMNPYERRIIHSALAGSEEVKTESCGKEPLRYVVIIPNNERVHSDRRDRGGKERRFNRDKNNNRRGDRRPQRDRGPRPAAAPKGKKQIYFGTFLGNSGDDE